MRQTNLYLPLVESYYHSGMVFNHKLYALHGFFFRAIREICGLIK